jgi:serine/threonine protein kinase
MEIEDRYNSIIEGIDPSHDFTLECFGYCPIKRTDFEPGIRMCDFGANEKTELYQMVYEDGGDDLEQAVTKHNFTEIFKGLSTVFHGVEQMVLNEFVHLDLKPPNMVFRKRKDKPTTVALIDFGLSMTFLEFQNQRTVCTHPYEYYPTEFPMLAKSALRKKNIPTDRIHDEQNLQKLHAQVRVLLYQIYYHPASSLELKNEIIECNQIFIADNIDYNLYYEENKVYSPNKIDVYSLGASILVLLATSHEAELAQITNNPAFYIDVLKLCRQMIHISPKERLDAPTANKKYNEIITRHHI